MDERSSKKNKNLWIHRIMCLLTARPRFVAAAAPGCILLPVFAVQCWQIPSFLWLSSGFVHLIPDAWQLSEEDNTVDTMYDAWTPQHAWHLIYLKHLFRLVNCPTKGGGGAGSWHPGEFEGLTLTSAPDHPTSSGQLPKWLWFFQKNTSSICRISPHISFSLIAWGVSIHRRVRGDTDPCYDAHPFLKGSAGDLWVALSGTLGPSCTRRRR